MLNFDFFLFRFVLLHFLIKSMTSWLATIVNKWSFLTLIVCLPLCVHNRGKETVLLLFLKMEVFFCSVCLTVEGVSYPTGTLLVHHINLVFLSPVGPSWASSAVCVSVCENVCVLCVSPLSITFRVVCLWVWEWLSVSTPSYWPSEVCVSVCVCLRPFKTHADQPQLQPSMMHLLPQLVATGEHLIFLICLLLFNFLFVCFFKFTFSRVFVTQPAHSWLPHIPHSNVLP